MSNRSCFALLVVLSALFASACDLLDEPCPEGTWRPRAMHECEPLPDTDSGTPTDAGTMDGSVADGAVADGAVSDGAVSDGAVADGAVSDGAVADGAVADGAVSDGAVADAGTDGG